MGLREDLEPTGAFMLSQFPTPFLDYAEQKHCHILDVVCTLLISTSFLERFLGEAALMAVHTINHLPSPTTHNKSPFELLHKEVPDYSFIWVFGCACFVSIPSDE